MSEMNAEIGVACNMCKSLQQIITIAACAFQTKLLKTVISDICEISFGLSA